MVVNCGNSEDPPYHGYDGLGDMEHKNCPDLDIIQKKNAITAMYHLVMEACVVKIKKYPFDYIFIDRIQNE